MNTRSLYIVYTYSHTTHEAPLLLGRPYYIYIYTLHVHLGPYMPPFGSYHIHLTPYMPPLGHNNTHVLTVAWGMCTEHSQIFDDHGLSAYIFACIGPGNLGHFSKSPPTKGYNKATGKWAWLNCRNPLICVCNPRRDGRPYPSGHGLTV
jgi:hypothetical protein